MAEDRKTQICETAAHLFALHGYNGASMRDIAKAIDLRGASLYAHISAKEDLLWIILDRAADEFLGHLEPLAADPELRPLEKLRAAVHAHVQAVTQNLDAATVYFHEWKHLTEPRRADFLARRARYEQCLRDIIAEGLAAEEFHPQVDPKFGALAVLSVVNWLYTWYRPDGVMSPTEIADQFLTMLLRGMLNPTAELEEVA